jgi:hypothetical protein
MNKPMDAEKPHSTTVDSFDEEEAGAVLRVRTGDIWADFMQVAPQSPAPGALPRHDGTVPLLDDMTGIRQWE